MSTNLTLLPMGDFLKMFHEDVHGEIKKMASQAGVSHVVCFENQDMWSPHLGERSAVIVGPKCTMSFEDVQKPGARIGDVPSRFKYPLAYAVINDGVRAYWGKKSSGKKTAPGKARKSRR